MIGHNPARLGIRRVNSNIWTPEGMSGLVNWLPMAEGAASAVQLIPDLVTMAGATYRGATVAVEATDPTWIAEGLSFDGGDYCNMSAAGTCVTAGSNWTVMILAKPTSSTGTLYCEGNAINSLRSYMYFSSSNTLWLRMKSTAADSFCNISHNGDEWQTLFTVVSGWTTAQLGVNGAAVGAPYTMSSLEANDTPTIRYLSCQGYQAATTDFSANPIGYVLTWNRALNDAEIAQVHNYIRGRVAGRGITLPAA